MEHLKDLQAEREYTAKVQQFLLAVIEQSRELSGSHSESIQMILADAWDELRLRPTALSPEEMTQLHVEIERFRVRRQFAEDMAERSHRMLMTPYFGRVDFIEQGQQGVEKIVIGLYSLPDEKGNLLVHDWRAPVCSLYYDALPGDVSYTSPSGEIVGSMTLKRQYRMENGQLKYYVDTQLNIDDDVLLDILSGSASQHMKQIVSSIQAEQNAAIRCDMQKVVSVVGSAGSGKTSVAMHRAAYLMFRRRDLLDADKIQILSPSTAFSEYVSKVLPELGEKNIRSRTMHEVVEGILGKKVEPPLRQLNRLITEDIELRRRSVGYKCSVEFMHALRRYADHFAKFGPECEDVYLEDQLLLKKEELQRMYKSEFTLLTPAQRLTRMRATLDTRLSSWEEKLYKQYEKSFEGKYSGRELSFVSRMAVSQRLQPVRRQLQEMLEVKGSAMLRRAMKDAPKVLRDAYEENTQANLTWWEDAVAEAYLTVRLGFVPQDKTVYHLLIDEAQDYSETALALLYAYHPNAHVTLLGDPKQRTCPGMPPCDPKHWGDCFGAVNAPVFTLSRCYRSTLPIARLCNAVLPDGEQIVPFGREGEKPLIAQYSEKLLLETLDRYRGAGHKSIAVVTRTQAQADSLSAKLSNVYRLDGGDADLSYEADDNIVACYHLTKGMEFDAVIVVWPECELTDEERRRLYTACSRALHAVALLGDGKLIKDLGIVL